MSETTTTHDRTVLSAHRFLTDDPKWSGAVEVVLRVSTYDGEPRVYVDVVLRVGTKFITLPIKALRSKALQGAVDAAFDEEEELNRQLRSLTGTAEEKKAALLKARGK